MDLAVLVLSVIPPDFQEHTSTKKMALGEFKSTEKKRSLAIPRLNEMMTDSPPDIKKNCDLRLSIYRNFLM